MFCVTLTTRSMSNNVFSCSCISSQADQTCTPTPILKREREHVQYYISYQISMLWVLKVKCFAGTFILSNQNLTFDSKLLK